MSNDAQSILDALHAEVREHDRRTAEILDEVGLDGTALRAFDEKDEATRRYEIGSSNNPKEMGYMPDDVAGASFGEETPLPAFCRTVCSLVCARAAAKKRFAEADVIDVAAGRMQDEDDDRETKRARTK